MTGSGDIIYIGGTFNIISKGITYSNIAKYNLSSQEWMHIESINNSISDLCMGTVDVNNATMYAIGKIQYKQSYHGVAGCDNNGNWVDYVNGGFSNSPVLTALIYLPSINKIVSMCLLFRYESILYSRR